MINKEHQLRLQRLFLTNKKLYWAVRYHRNNNGGERMSFINSLFLVPIYEALDKYRSIVIPKAVQSGVSEAFIISHFEEASRGLSILYTLPKSDLRDSFVKNRVNRVISRVPFYKQILQSNDIGKADSVHMKFFGKGVIKYVDANSPSNFVEFPADAIYLDELDQMNQFNIERAADRLDASKHKLERVVANPSIENFGIDLRWKESSKGIWYMKCPACRDYQHLNWFENVVRVVGERQYELRDREWDKENNKEPRVFCRKCENVLYRFAKGEYVHAFPNREIKGFHIDQIFGARYVTMNSLVKKFFKALVNDSKLQIFFNSNLGLPFTAQGSKITETDLEFCNLADFYQKQSNDDGLVCMGIDVGIDLHVVIRKLAVVNGVEKKVVLFVGTVRTEDEIIALANRYHVKGGVIDSLPETRLVERLQSKLSYLYACSFHIGKYPTVNKEKRIVTVDRTTIMDELKENVINRQIGNFSNMKSVKGYYEHLQANTRVYDANSNRFNWVQSSEDDHYALAEVYNLISFKLKTSTDAMSFYDQWSDEALERQGAGKSPSQVLQSIQDRFYGKGV